jgi:hypothetical protein
MHAKHYLVIAGQKARSAVSAPSGPAIHAFLAARKSVDGRDKPGHDELRQFGRVP